MNADVTCPRGSLYEVTKKYLGGQRREHGAVKRIRQNRSSAVRADNGWNNVFEMIRDLRELESSVTIWGFLIVGAC